MSQCRPGLPARQLVVSRVGRRPERVEPRAVTRRPKPHALLTYTLTVGNVGGRNLNGVVLGMVVPEFTSVSSSSITDGCSPRTDISPIRSRQPSSRGSVPEGDRACGL